MAGLMLVPTPAELAVIEANLPPASLTDWRIELCGFGPIAAASRSAALIERHRPDQVVLLGIAGSFGDALAIGSAVTFGQVHCWGIGVGSGAVHQSADAMGFPQWNGDRPVGQLIELTTSQSRHVLLTCCAASANDQEANRKRTAIPTATAEDMEGYGVALSCRIADVPLTIIRGISNHVGERNRDHWQVEAALRAAAALATSEICSRDSA
jgi:futalosine hydrolase